MPNALIKVQKEGQLVLPKNLRDRAGIAEGDLLEVTMRGSEVVLTPKSIVTAGPLKREPNQGRKQQLEFERRLRASAPASLGQVWASSKARGTDKITMREIDVEIAKARAESPSQRKAHRTDR